MKYDETVIDSAFKKIIESKRGNMRIHFVYDVDNFYSPHNIFKPLIRKGIEKYKIKKVMVTIINMWRDRLITKEKMENYCKGKEVVKISVNDDLETLFEDIQLGKKPDEFIEPYFLPKLTEHELELVEQKDEAFMKTLYVEMEAHAHGCEISAFKSDSKYVHGWGHRKTFTIEN